MYIMKINQVTNLTTISLNTNTCCIFFIYNFLGPYSTAKCKKSSLMCCRCKLLPLQRVLHVWSKSRVKQLKWPAPKCSEHFWNLCAPAGTPRNNAHLCVRVCSFVIKVQKVKVTWSVPVTVQWENHSSPVNEGGQVHKTSVLSTDACHNPPLSPRTPMINPDVASL